MYTRSDNEAAPSRHWLRGPVAGVFNILWTGIRLPALALLLVMEPLVCGVLSGVAALGVLCTLFFGLLVRPPHFPFWLMLGISAGIALLMIPYYALIRLFSSSP